MSWVDAMHAKTDPKTRSDMIKTLLESIRSLSSNLTATTFAPTITSSINLHNTTKSDNSLDSTAKQIDNSQSILPTTTTIPLATPLTTKVPTPIPIRPENTDTCRSLFRLSHQKLADMNRPVRMRLVSIKILSELKTEPAMWSARSSSMVVSDMMGLNKSTFESESFDQDQKSSIIADSEEETSSESGVEEEEIENYTSSTTSTTTTTVVSSPSLSYSQTQSQDDIMIPNKSLHTTTSKQKQSPPTARKNRRRRSKRPPVILSDDPTPTDEPQNQNDGNQQPPSLRRIPSVVMNLRNATSPLQNEITAYVTAVESSSDDSDDDEYDSDMDSIASGEISDATTCVSETRSVRGGSASGSGSGSSSGGLRRVNSSDAVAGMDGGSVAGASDGSQVLGLEEQEAIITTVLSTQQVESQSPPQRPISRASNRSSSGHRSSNSNSNPNSTSTSSRSRSRSRSRHHHHHSTKDILSISISWHIPLVTASYPTKLKWGTTVLSPSGSSVHYLAPATNYTLVVNILNDTDNTPCDLCAQEFSNLGGYPIISVDNYQLSVLDMDSLPWEVGSMGHSSWRYKLETGLSGTLQFSVTTNSVTTLLIALGELQSQVFTLGVSWLAPTLENAGVTVDSLTQIQVPSMPSSFKANLIPGASGIQVGSFGYPNTSANTNIALSLNGFGIWSVVPLKTGLPDTDLCGTGGPFFIQGAIFVNALILHTTSGILEYRKEDEAGKTFVWRNLVPQCLTDVAFPTQLPTFNNSHCIPAIAFSNKVGGAQAWILDQQISDSGLVAVEAK
ncbi:hypothetical protein HDU76_003542, partial [Blyttiomyces sp. JEL0837]